MVGRKNSEMIYNATITSVGQVTIPKPIREALNLLDRVTIERRGDEVVLKREKTLKEKLEEIDSLVTPEQKRLMKQNAGLTVREIREKMLQTPEGRKFDREWYGY